ncbi:MAG: hypothetical protein JSV77_04005 [Dehalococcoidales bacterium]|nr:MAG: hypothetical protein JSV77_04005 [Dehalococcoidales bacterium]
MRKPLHSIYLPVSLTVLDLGGLYTVSLYYYATFLSLASLFSIALALGILILVWTSRHYLNNNYLLLIGIAYLFIDSLQMAHTLALGADAAVLTEETIIQLSADLTALQQQKQMLA